MRTNQGEADNVATILEGSPSKGALMRRLSELPGRAIVAADTGQKLGTVSDVLIDAQGRRIVGFIVGGQLLTSERVVPSENVQAMGDAVIARSQERVVGAREWRDGDNDSIRASTLKNKPVMTVGGRRLGVIKDVQVEEQTGVITGYEVSGGTLTGFLTRRNLLPESTDIRIGPDAVIVTEETARELETGPEPT
jgi:uncharacterized protein YrrD